MRTMIPPVLSNAQRNQAVRREVIALLGGCCVECGFADARALQVDHVKGDGAAERRSTPHATLMRRVLLSWRSGERGVYQLLCANCNWIKRVENGEAW